MPSRTGSPGAALPAPRPAAGGPAPGEPPSPSTTVCRFLIPTSSTRLIPQVLTGAGWGLPPEPNYRETTREQMRVKAGERARCTERCRKTCGGPGRPAPRRASNGRASFEERRDRRRGSGASPGEGGDRGRDAAPQRCPPPPPPPGAHLPPPRNSAGTCADFTGAIAPGRLASSKSLSGNRLLRAQQRAGGGAGMK